MKIICIGRNYHAHARELNNPLPAEPVFFLKPDTALLRENAPFFHPEFSNDIHHELELVLRISKAGKHIDEKFASRYFHEITVGLDFTARDLQEEQKKQGLPWEKAKAFDGSAPVGEFVSLNDLPNPGAIGFHLELNGSVKQQGNSEQMIFSFAQIISFVSKFITLKTGDLIFTGTPAGVGPIKQGDQLKCWLEDRCLLECAIK